MKFAVRVYMDDPPDGSGELSDRDAGAMLRHAMANVTDRIGEGFRGGVVRTIIGEPIGEWQYSPESD